MLPPFLCTLRQGLRRASWFLLFVGGLFLYPAQIAWQVSHATEQVLEASAPRITSAQQLGDVAAQAAAAEMAKVVDPAYLFSKLSIAVGVFCLINLLAWLALNMVLPVLPNWAVGRYATQEGSAAVGLPSPVVGFKRTFLHLSDLQRIGVYFLGFGLQLLAAGLGVWAAFTIQ